MLVLNLSLKYGRLSCLHATERFFWSFDRLVASGGCHLSRKELFRVQFFLDFACKILPLFERFATLFSSFIEMNRLLVAVQGLVCLGLSV